jgi:hypothetical protein
MKAQSDPGIGGIYIVSFILLVGVGGYWILHSNTWFDHSVLYGPEIYVNGKVTRIDYCQDTKKTLVMLETDKSQAYVYMNFKFDVLPDDSLTVKAYNVTGRGILFDLTRFTCEPEGSHYLATRAYNSRTGLTMEGRPWNK